MNRVSFIFLVALIFVSCRDDDEGTLPAPNATGSATRTYDGDFLREYFYLNCDVSQTTEGFFPTQVARAYGYIGIAAYESVVHGIDPSKSLDGQLQGFSQGSIPDPLPNVEYNWALACNAATADMMRRMFEIKITPENLALINDMEADNNADLIIGVSRQVVERSIDYGLSVAEAVYAVSVSDGAHQSQLDPFQLPFDMQEDDYCWMPTDDLTLNPLSPYWGDNRSLIPGVVEAAQPPGHLPFSAQPGSAFYQQALEVYEQVTVHNTDAERHIAEYWADDPFQTCTPAGHTFNIVTQLLEESNATLEKTAVGLAMMSIAENDAFIACWRSKYDYVLIRPVTYIQEYIDPDFLTVIGTPPFPAYISGHSAEIGAGIKVMIHLFAKANGDYTFTDLSQLRYGFPAREYDNFYELAAECALSRFYGGIHFEMDNVNGMDVGYTVGDAVVNDLHWPQNTQ